MRTDPITQLHEAELLARLPDDQASAVREQLGTFDKACGCQEGAVAGFVGLTAVALLALAFGWGPAWLALVTAIAAFVAGVGTGKWYGLQRARSDRRALVAELSRRGDTAAG